MGNSKIEVPKSQNGAKSSYGAEKSFLEPFGNKLKLGPETNFWMGNSKIEVPKAQNLSGALTEPKISFGAILK